MGHFARVQPNAHGVASAEDHDVTHAFRALDGVHQVDVGVARQVDGVKEVVGRVERVEHDGQAGGLLDRHAHARHLAGQLGRRLLVAHVGELLVRVGVGARREDDVDAARAVVRRGGAHVVHILEAGELKLDGVGHGVRHFLSVGAGVVGAELDGDGGDIGVLRDGQTHHADDAQQGGDNGDDTGDDGVFDEEW